MADERLIQIEMVLAHHEKKIEELSEMTNRQWEEIDRLRRQVERTQAQILDMEASAKDPKSEAGLSNIEIAALNKPPHY